MDVIREDTTVNQPEVLDRRPEVQELATEVTRGTESLLRFGYNRQEILDIVDVAFSNATSTRQ